MEAIPVKGSLNFNWVRMVHPRTRKPRQFLVIECYRRFMPKVEGTAEGSIHNPIDKFLINIVLRECNFFELKSDELFVIREDDGNYIGNGEVYKMVSRPIDSCTGDKREDVLVKAVGFQINSINVLMESQEDADVV